MSLFACRRFAVHVSLLGLAACATTTPLPVASPPPTPDVVAAPVVAAPAPMGPMFELEVTPAATAVLADKATEMLVRVRVKGLAVQSAKRPPLNLALVVDTSGSMEGAAIDKARDACGALVDGLAPGDALSIVTFGSSAKVIVPATLITAEAQAKAREAIRAIKAEGTTDMAGGLQAGLAQAQTFFSNEGVSRVVLVGDGVPNEPVNVPALADQAGQQRMPITTLGLGPDFEETLMSAVAQRSGGAFHFVADASSVAQVFKDELVKVEHVVAQNVFVDVVPGPGVVLEEVLGADPSPLSRGSRLSLGELKADQTRDVVLRVKIPGHHDGSKIELLDAVAHGFRVASGVEVTAQKFTGLDASKDAKAASDEKSEELEHQGARLRAASGIVHAIALARSGDLKGARALLDATAARATLAGSHFHDAELTAKAKEAQSIKKTLASLAPPPEVPDVAVPVGGGRRPATAPRPPPVASPAAALEVKTAHAGAMKVLQGE
jgi:Ca-activated chloride channel family protein